MSACQWLTSMAAMRMVMGVLFVGRESSPEVRFTLTSMGARREAGVAVSFVERPPSMRFRHYNPSESVRQPIAPVITWLPAMGRRCRSVNLTGLLRRSSVACRSPRQGGGAERGQRRIACTRPLDWKTVWHPTTRQGKY